MGRQEAEPVQQFALEGFKASKTCRGSLRLRLGLVMAMQIRRGSSDVDNVFCDADLSPLSAFGAARSRVP